MRLASAFAFRKNSTPFKETRCKHNHRSIRTAQECASRRREQAIAENGGKVKNGSSIVLPCVIVVVGQ